VVRGIATGLMIVRLIKVYLARLEVSFVLSGSKSCLQQVRSERKIQIVHCATKLLEPLCAQSIAQWPGQRAFGGGTPLVYMIQGGIQARPAKELGT
jgi:hypothetical protein